MTEKERAAIEAAARDIGIVPGDPAYPFVRFMMGMVDDLAQQQDGLLKRFDQVVAEARTIATGEIATLAARGLPETIRQATFREHRTSFLLAAFVLVCSIVISGCGGLLWGQRVEAERYIQIPVALGAALTGPDAAQWLNLIRLNNIGAATRTCATHAGGDACDFSFWVRRPPAK